MHENFSKEGFDNSTTSKTKLKSMMINNDHYDEDKTSSFDFLLLSIIFIPLIILFLKIFY
ncbi:hypothetical protein E2556_07685 [Staphylococcus croceilyticus]|uniref:Uncharacterized protein n=1 Tax=Staphylococcus croceilyticus TaxID=319942 RepID=A0ABY2KC28_9STAP|nr:hypothetical protein CD128_00275 [Staphylococcus croceilyticus]TGA78234.1 hypothetical protein E2556_07685 [Staphylococcus croceilyticus]